MKMCIIVFGNIASGKSTFSRHLLGHFPNYQHICLDDFRLEAARHTDLLPIQREKLAEKLCLEAITQADNIILETTAASQFWETMWFALRQMGFKTVNVKIDCPVNICVQRFNNRKFEGHKSVVPPFKTKSIVQMMYDIEYKRKLVKADIVIHSTTASPEDMVALFLKFVIL
jgi:dephospho-CoA kinase